MPCSRFLIRYVLSHHHLFLILTLIFRGFRLGFPSHRHFRSRLLVVSLPSTYKFYILHLVHTQLYRLFRLFHSVRVRFQGTLGLIFSSKSTLTYTYAYVYTLLHLFSTINSVLSLSLTC